MNDKRQINGEKYNIPELVNSAITAAESDPRTFDTISLDRASKSLSYLGNRNPSDEQLRKYARESAILAILGRSTGANFQGQIGKIDFSSTERAIADVQSYLNRRNQGQHARWTESHKRY